jgi:hypothetical protein
MGDEPYTTQRKTSSARSDHSRVNLQAEYAAERAGLMFGCYRRGDANNPDTYVAAVAMVLSKYAVEVIKAVTDPYAGLPSKKKENGYSGLPDVADVREACDDEAGRIARMERYSKLPAPDFNRPRLAAPQRVPGDLATVFVPMENPRYAELLDWARTADGRLWKVDDRPGIWVSHDTWDRRQVAARMGAPAAGLKPLTLSEDALRAMADIDAERRRQLPVDRPTDAYQEAE